MNYGNGLFLQRPKATVFLIYQQNHHAVLATSSAKQLLGSITDFVKKNLLRSERWFSGEQIFNCEHVVS